MKKGITLCLVLKRQNHSLLKKISIHADISMAQIINDLLREHLPEQARKWGFIPVPTEDLADEEVSGDGT